MILTPTFQGEVQFRRWSDSSTQGVQITFSLADSDDLEPLKAKAGKRFMAVLVEIGDDETPVQPAPRKDTRGPLCREACDMCAMPEFQKWATLDTAIEPSEGNAKKFLFWTCKIDSRKELDFDTRAANDFVRLIRIPFMKHMKSQRQAA